MTIQRRTFLGGLLAAVATATVYGRVAIPEARIVEAEKRLLGTLPEPEEGFRLIVNPGYGLPEMHAISIMPVANAIPPGPEFTIQMARPHFLSNGWNGSIKPVVHDQYRRCSLEMHVEGDDVRTVLEWISRLCGSTRDYFTPMKSDYAGTGTFGQASKEPLIKFEGLFPTSVQTDWYGKKQTARVEMSFDWVHQEAL
jgi:hypothetical protein